MFPRTMALAAAGAVCLATAAFAGNFEVRNGTERNLHHLYLSPVSQNAWGVDQLGDSEDSIVEPGSTFMLTGIADGVYDVKITLGDGSSCVVRGIVFEGDMEWTVDDATTHTC